MKNIKQFKNNESQNSNKLHLDKYYTPTNLAKYCIDKTYEIIGEENITHIIEPSAGSGSFSNQLECDAYDIEPEHKSIARQDFLELDIPHQKGRLIIGNPPYGDRLNLAIKFYKKSIQISDYISFILPISQFNNTQKTYEFDLVHSEDLGLCIYNGSYRNIHCCLNIYKIPNDGMFNKKQNNNLKDVEVIEVCNSTNRKKLYCGDYDIAIKSYGGTKGTPSQVGHEVHDLKKYAKTFCIKINNDLYRDEILELLRNVDWHDLYPMTSTPCLYKWQICKYIKDNIVGIK